MIQINLQIIDKTIGANNRRFRIMMALDRFLVWNWIVRFGVFLLCDWQARRRNWEVLIQHEIELLTICLEMVSNCFVMIQFKRAVVANKADSEKRSNLRKWICRNRHIFQKESVLLINVLYLLSIFNVKKVWQFLISWIKIIESVSFCLLQKVFNGHLYRPNNLF